MTEEFLLQAVGEIEEELVVQAEEYRPAKRPSLRRPLTALAACVAVVFVLYWGAGNLGMGGANSGSTSASTGSGGADAESQENGSGITESSGNSTGDWCPAIMVDGQLYWSSGQVLSSVDESAILGTTTYTDGVPDQDGQANFEREGTRYARTDGGIAVEMDGEWVLFTTKGP